jgi:hypothetical protein
MLQSDVAPPDDEDRQMEAVLDGSDELTTTTATSTLLNDKMGNVRARTGWDEAEDSYDKVHKVCVCFYEKLH